MILKKLTFSLLAGLFLFSFSSTAASSTRYIAESIQVPFSYNEYTPAGFIIDGTTGHKMPNASYGKALDGKGEPIGIKLGTEGDVLELFRDTAEGETGHVVGTIQMPDRTLAVGSFVGKDGQPSRAKFYCLPEVGDEVAVGFQDAGGNRTQARSFKIVDTDGDSVPNLMVVAGASVNAGGRTVPVLWHGPIDGCQAPDQLVQLPLPDAFAGDLNAHGLASAVMGGAGAGLEIFGTVRTRQGDALVSWKRSAGGGVTSEVLAMSRRSVLQINDSFVAPHEFGIVGTRFKDKTDAGPHPLAMQRNALGEWEEIILGWDGTSMATPHFMNYTDDDLSTFLAGGTAFVEDRTFDDEVRGVLWKGISGFAGSDEEIGALAMGRALDASRIIQDDKGGFLVRDVVDFDPASGRLLASVQTPQGSTGAAFLTPGNSLVPELLRNNLTGEVTDGPYSVWNQAADKFQSVPTRNAFGSFEQTIDLTAGFMDYSDDAVVAPGISVSGYATFPTSYASKGLSAEVYIYDYNISEYLFVGSRPVPNGAFSFDISGFPDVFSPPGGLLKCRIRITAPERQKFEVRIDQFVFHTID